MGNRLVHRAYDLEPGRESLLREALAGLRRPQKELPTKYLYDERGAGLFDRICKLEDYYITRTEASIMEASIGEIAKCLGRLVALVEYGSGNCKKVRHLLDHLDDPVAYIPIDISREQLLHVAEQLASDYPDLEVQPVCADYLSVLDLPASKRPARRRCVYFPGSTIGNFEPAAAQFFFKHIRGVCGRTGALLIGVDLQKDPAVLHRAYNDREGITAAFNLNVLERMNRELGCDFQPARFYHYAFYNPGQGRIEMHLISRHAQTVRVGDEAIPIAAGESIWTESSYKYTLDGFARLAAAGGFKTEGVWLDDQQWFSVQYLVPD